VDERADARVPVGCVDAFTQLRVFTEKRPEPVAALPMRLDSQNQHCAVWIEVLMMAGLPEGARVTPPSSMGSSALMPALADCRYRYRTW